MWVQNKDFSASQDCLGKRKQVYFVRVLGPNPGPGCLPLQSGREDIELAIVFVPMPSLAFSFLSKFIFWNLVENNVKGRSNGEFPLVSLSTQQMVPRPSEDSSRKLCTTILNLLLTILFRPHQDCVGAQQEAHKANVLFTERAQINYMGLIFGAPGSTGSPGLRMFGGQTNSSLFVNPNASCPRTSLEYGQLLRETLVITSSF